VSDDGRKRAAAERWWWVADSRVARGGVVVFGILLIAAIPSRARSYTVRCHDVLDAPEVVQAIDEIRRLSDPCGETRELRQLVAKLQRCTGATYRVCTDEHADRNSFYKPPEGGDNPSTATDARTIHWNPKLRSELESGCDGDPDKPVLRDPTASLVHELVHAAQDCDGLDPSEHEFEAVRIENIYRRAKGMCQRARYGSDLLPGSMVKACDHRTCTCSSGSAPLDTLPARNAPQHSASITCDSADCAR